MKDMKQIFLNKFSRSDKSEAPVGWPDDLDQIEQTADELKRVLGDVTKRISACLVSVNPSSGGGSGGAAGVTPHTSGGGGCGVGPCLGPEGATMDTLMNNNNNNGGGIAALTPAERDKRLRKLPESVLAQTLLESGEKFSALNPSLKTVFCSCGQTINRISEERLVWEHVCERHVVDRFRHCLDEEIPAMIRSRKQLWKMSGELKAARERLKNLDNTSPNLQQSNHQHHYSDDNLLSSQQQQIPSLSIGGSGSQSQHESVETMSMGNMSNHQVSTSSSGADNSKVQQLRTNKEDLELEVGHLKDQCLRDYYRFDGSLVEYSRAMVDLLSLEADYHRRCLQYLDMELPKLKAEIGYSSPIPVVGRSLMKHLESSNRSISYVLDLCIRSLDTPAVLMEEGLFRIAGSKSKVDTLISALNVMRAEKIIDEYDPYVIADALKQYLRSLPEPILTFHLFEDWINATNQSSPGDQIQALWHCCYRLPPAHWINLAFLIRFLSRLTSHSTQNKMTPGNLGIVFGPNLLVHPTMPNLSPKIQPNSQDPFAKSQLNQNSSPNSTSKPTASMNHQGSVNSSSSHNKVKGPAISGPVIISRPDLPATDVNHVTSLENRRMRGGSGGPIDMTSSTDPNHELSVKLMSTNVKSTLVELLITYCDIFFPSDVSDPRSSSYRPPSYHQHIFSSSSASNSPSHNHYPHHAPSPSSSLPSSLLINASRAVTTASTPPNPNSRGIAGRAQTTASSRPRGFAGDSLTGGPTRSMTTPDQSTSARQPLGPRRSSMHDTVDGVSDDLMSNQESSTSTPGAGVDPKVFPSTYYRRRISDGAAMRSKSAVRTPNMGDVQYEEAFDDPPPSNGPSSFTTPSQPMSGHHTTGRIGSKPYQAKSFHADVYDTLFALQSLNSHNGVGDYLSRVRTLYEGRTLVKGSEGTGGAPAVVPSFVPGSTRRSDDSLQAASTPSNTAKATSVGAKLALRRDMFSSYSEDRSDAMGSDGPPELPMRKTPRDDRSANSNFRISTGDPRSSPSHPANPAVAAISGSQANGGGSVVAQSMPALATSLSDSSKSVLTSGSRRDGAPTNRMSSVVVGSEPMATATLNRNSIHTGVNNSTPPTGNFKASTLPNNSSALMNSSSYK